jgi:hypothetical protein
MRSFVLSLILGLACLSTACTGPKTTQVASAPTTQTAAQSAAAGPSNPNDRVCTTHEVSGTRIPVRECHTLAEWDASRKHGMDQLGVEAQRTLPSKGGN